MGQLAFSSDDRLFDGECVRFTGRDGQREVLCGVTIFALKHHDPNLPMDGLLPAELFLDAYDRFMIKIHDMARRKHDEGRSEPDGPIEIMVHDEDWK
ncbi:MAG: DUF1488 family protein [Anderseniella sp.]